MVNIVDMPGPPITPGLITDFANGEGILILPWQRGIIHAMDCAFRETLADVIVKNEEHRKRVEENRPKIRRR